MRNTSAGRAQALRQLAAGEGIGLRTVALDVQSEESVQAAVATVLAEAGELDVVVDHAGHLAIGYVEAFATDDVGHLFDVNVLGGQRVNRAVLPYLRDRARDRARGTLLYVGSTSITDASPFLGPYVASEAAFDATAQAMRYEVVPLGIETAIVMPGPFTRGTSRSPNASRASGESVAHGHAALDPLVARDLEATNSLFEPGVDPGPVTVAEEITRILALPCGTVSVP